jgi:hypothetical protein
MEHLIVGDKVRCVVDKDLRFTITHIDIDTENAMCWGDDNKAYIIPLVILEKVDLKAT